jgi:hypothetical protein
MAAQPKEVVISEDEWQRRSTASAIASARDVVSKEGINARVPVGSLGDLEWGWIVASAIFGWIKTRAEQAVHEGTAYDIPIRTMAGEPPPWDAGAIATILPALGGMNGVDWSKPVGEWSKEQIVSFAWQIHKLTDGALARRDDGSKPVDFSQERTERLHSANVGGPMMSRNELNDEIGF